MDVTRTLLWSGGLSQSSLIDRVEAAAANGYSAIALSPGDGLTLVDQARELAELRRRAAGLGVELSVLDAVTEWYPHEPPKRLLVSPFLTSDEVLGIAAAVGLSKVSAVAPYPTGISVEGLTEHFANLCDRAAVEGVGIQLEFTPFAPVGSLATAWEIVGLAARPNAGIVFDTWHFFQGAPDFEVLQTVPGDRIWAVQISDGVQGAYVEGLVKDTFRHRRQPGEGTFDLAGVLHCLDEIGGLHAVGPEVLSEKLFAMPVAENVRVTAEKFDRFVATLR